MLGPTRRLALGAALSAFALASSALAFGDKCDKCEPPPKPICFCWKQQEICETVYVVEYKEVKTKVKRPVVKEVPEEVSCKVCKPYSRTVLRTCPALSFETQYKTVDTVKTRCVTDECGHVHEVCEVCPETVACVVRKDVPVDYPALEWEMIPVEHKYTKTHLKYEMEDVEVVVRMPVKTPKVITRKVWVKVPYCEPCRPACEPVCPTCNDGTVVEETVLTEVPTESRSTLRR